MYCTDEAIAYLEVEAGEAILIHNWLLHRSKINHTGMPRRALTTCYMDGRTLSTLTGTRFPIVFGEHEDAESALPFLRAALDENRLLRDMAAEAERHAKSLLEDNRLREQMRCEAERYANSLLEDSRLREQMRSEAERYALSLEAELAKIRTAQAPGTRVR